MKKTIFTISAFLTLALVSCKKDRVCECTSAGSSTVDKTTLIKVTKRQGLANCVSTSYDNGDGTIDKVTCELK